MTVVNLRLGSILSWSKRILARLNNKSLFNPVLITVARLLTPTRSTGSIGADDVGSCVGTSPGEMQLKWATPWGKEMEGKGPFVYNQRAPW